MKLIEANINNYKSIGNKRSKLKVDENVTALIGKNESGKSNLLEALAKLSLKKQIESSYFVNINRKTEEDIKIILTFEFTPKEIKELGDVQEHTYFYFERSGVTCFSGGLSTVIENNETLQSNITRLEEIVHENVCNLEKIRIDEIKKYLDKLKKIDSEIYYTYIIDTNRMIALLKNHEDAPAIIASIGSDIEKYYSLLPDFYYSSGNSQLKDNYTKDQIIELLKNKTDIFCKFLTAAQIEDTEILAAFQETNVAKKKDIRYKIEKKIKVNIQAGFNEFYKQENVKIEVEFDSGYFRIYIKTSENAMTLSERSNGLRWYLNLYIDILSQNYKNIPSIFLFDEPGVYLHVNAQKKVLELFDDLASKGNQVIYTTHSPYMLNSEEITNLRAVQKNTDEITEIYNNIYDSQLAGESKMDTLTPFLKSLGMNFTFNFKDKMLNNNIITEGIIDCFYIKAMLKYMNVASSEDISIIPSVGVDNIDKIASILLGWGLKFKVVVDYDKQGNDEYKRLLSKLNLIPDEQVCFVNCKTQIEKIEEKDYETIECLVSKEDYELLENPYIPDIEGTKILAAKEFYDKVSKGNIELSEDTIRKFTQLFVKLGLIEK